MFCYHWYALYIFAGHSVTFLSMDPESEDRIGTITTSIISDIDHVFVLGIAKTFPTSYREIFG